MKEKAWWSTDLSKISKSPIHETYKWKISIVLHMKKKWKVNKKKKNKNPKIACTYNKTLYFLIFVINVVVTMIKYF